MQFFAAKTSQVYLKKIEREREREIKKVLFVFDGKIEEGEESGLVVGVGSSEH